MIVERGLSDLCSTGQHALCTSPGCICGHHAQNRAPQPVQNQSVASALICSKCSKVPRAGDVFCRVDGEKLIAGKQCMCGRGMEPDDKFCGACGREWVESKPEAPKTDEPLVDALAQVESEEFKRLEAELAANAKSRPSVEAPAVEVS